MMNNGTFWLLFIEIKLINIIFLKYQMKLGMPTNWKKIAYGYQQHKPSYADTYG